MSETDPNTMPLEDLASLIDSTGLGDQGETVVSEPEPEATQESELEQAPEETPEEVVETEEAPPKEPEKTDVDPEAFAAKLRDERIEQVLNSYQKLQEHSSRQAGEIGHLRRKLEQRERGEIDDSGSVAGASELEERLRKVEEMSARDAVTRAISEEFAAHDSRPEVQALNLAPEFAQVAPKYRERAAALSAMTDPEEARIAARGLSLSVLSDALHARLQAGVAKANGAAARSKASMQAKRASAAVSSSGGTRAARPRSAPDPNTMPLDDLKKLIDSMGAPG